MITFETVLPMLYVTPLTWQELAPILSHPTNSPRLAVQAWYESGLLEQRFPEVHALFGIPQPPAHHPEIDTGVHTLMVTEQAWLRSKDPAVVFAALVHDLGKGVTPQDQWPKHTDHETNGVPLVKNVCARLGVPPDVENLALMVCEFHLHGHRVFEMRPGSVVQWLEKSELLHNTKLRQQFMLACEADARGRTGLENREYLSPYYVETVARLAQSTWHIEARQERLQAAITAVKHHYAPIGNKDNVKAIVRRDAGLAPIGQEPSHGDTPAC